MGGGVNGRMRLVVLTSVSRPLEGAIQQSDVSRYAIARNDARLGILAPGLIVSLLLDEGLEVECLVVLVRFSPRVAQESSLIQLLSYL